MIIDVQCAKPNQPSVDDIARAFTKLADRIDRQGFADMYDEDGFLAFTWRFPNGELNDQEFFAELVEGDARNLVPALRRLLQSYLAADKKYAEAWADEDGQAAFSYAMRALILLDPENSRELLLDCIENMPTHVAPTLDMILSDFVEKHGFKTNADIRFGLAIIFRQHRGYSKDGVWESYGLLRRAEKIMTGTAFGEAVIVVMESEHARWVRRARERSGDDTWHSELNIEGCISDIVFLLGSVPDRGFGRDLRNKLSERWDVRAAEKAHRDEKEKVSRGMDAIFSGNVKSGLRDLIDEDAVRAAGLNFDDLVAELEDSVKN